MPRPIQKAGRYAVMLRQGEHVELVDRGKLVGIVVRDGTARVSQLGSVGRNSDLSPVRVRTELGQNVVLDVALFLGSLDQKLVLTRTERRKGILAKGRRSKREICLR